MRRTVHALPRGRSCGPVKTAAATSTPNAGRGVVTATVGSRRRGGLSTRSHTDQGQKRARKSLQMRSSIARRPPKAAERRCAAELAAGRAFAAFVVFSRKTPRRKTKDKTPRR